MNKKTLYLPPELTVLAIGCTHPIAESFIEQEGSWLNLSGDDVMQISNGIIL